MSAPASRFSLLLFSVLAILLSACSPTSKNAPMHSAAISDAAIRATISAIAAQHPGAAADRIERGVKQAAALWRAEDGTEKDFTAFCSEHFCADSAAITATFERFEHNLMLIEGTMTELGRDLRRPTDLDLGPPLPADALFSEFSPAVHASDDFFKTKLAFVALLNFPLTTLEQRLKDGPSWTRRQWAEARLASRFATRIPAEANQAATSAYAIADAYIASYNIHMNSLLDANGARPFPEGLKLITHWGLRDELKAQYGLPGGLERQRMIRAVMEHIIAQTIPAAVIDNPKVDWTLAANTVAARAGSDLKDVSAAAEADVRYAKWLAIFQAERKLDPYYPDEPTFIDRKFKRNREIPEQEVEALLTSVLSSPLAKRVGTLISSRLGRPLEPFDVWYNGFKSRPPFTEAELDAIVARKYPTVDAVQRDLPNILAGLGFSKDKAAWLAQRITVDPSRGAGHAMEAGRLTDNAHLRTRIAATGMNYKGYNIAIHELGHNVEQTFSFQGIDHSLLRGVPNTAFTEGFAFVFQSRDLALLGFMKKDPDAEALSAIDVFWSTFEIAGVGLIDMRAWRWLYAHPDASPAQFKDAVTGIAKDVWNEYYAPVFGVRDVPLLAIYSHTIDAGMYTPDYSLGHIISFQLEEYMKTRSLATEMERMCKIGGVSPDLWMRSAVGAPISTEPLLSAAAKALDVVTK